MARAIFGAKASSIFLLDEEADELVFEAVAGEGAETLIGKRFPSSTGIAGWVLVTRQPLVIEDVDRGPALREGVRREDRLRAEGPDGGAAAPRGAGAGRARGARPARSGAQFSLVEMDLLGLFANQAAIALDLLRRARRAQAVLAESGEGSDVVARLAETVDGLEDEKREAGLKLLGALEEVLRRDEGGYEAALETRLSSGLLALGGLRMDDGWMTWPSTSPSLACSASPSAARGWMTGWTTWPSTSPSLACSASPSVVLLTIVGHLPAPFASNSY